MARLSDRMSKMWIYLPIYILSLVFAIKFVHGYFRNAPVEQKRETKKKPAKESVAIKCLNQSKKNLEGIFSITPTKRVKESINALGDECSELLCDELYDVRNRRLSPKEFYTLSSKNSTCFNPLLNDALSYHFKTLEKYQFQTFFYNSGQYNLSSQQKKQLSFFLKLFKKKKDKYSLLIIGRASQIGDNNKNKILSRKRSEAIVDFIKNYEMSAMDVVFTYFGSDPPQLTMDLARQLGIDASDFRSNSFGKGNDRDYSIRLNQSVLLIIYPTKEDPYGLLK